ncbi:IS3 family transposase [Clostridium sp. CF011]
MIFQAVACYSKSVKNEIKDYANYYNKYRYQWTLKKPLWISLGIVDLTYL